MTSLPPGPARVQIQTQSVCNGRCVFCPNEAVRRTDLAQGRMDPALFHRIVDELAETRPRRISLYLMNEPLLDPRLPDFIRYASAKVPDATTLVTTNGSPLDESCARALLESGLKRIKVSLQSLDPETNRQIMGPACDRDAIVENVLQLKRLMKEDRTSHLDLRISTIVTRQNQAEIERARRFWKRHGIRLVTSALENRGGNIHEAAALNPHAMAPMGLDCVRPSREMCILFNGDVVLCCVDWFRTVVMGNVAEQSVRDIWNGTRFTQIRQALRLGDRTRWPSICAHCSESAQPHYHRHGLKGLFARLGPQPRPRI